METEFRLHERLAADTIRLGDWPLSRVLLMNDAQYPWVILVPRREHLREIYELDPADQQQLMAESVRAGRTLMQLFGGHKLNVAALGNVVPQLHLHHIVRREDDPAWPAPVWGRLPVQPYGETALGQRVALLRAHLELAAG